jgi:hypothetical protein
MIFSAINEDGEPLWKLVLDGKKTVTRRLKPHPIGSIRAIQPKRTSKAIGHIKILDCRKELYFGQGVANTETEAHLEELQSLKKSFLENELCDMSLISEETGAEYPCSFKRNHKGLHSFEDSRNIKDSLENEKEKGGIITIHSVDVVTPELISKSMFPKKKDDKK